jgi:signal transduction histidine kinase
MTSLRSRLLRRLIVSVSLTLVLGGGSLFFFLRQRMIDQFDDALIDKARLLAGSVIIEEDGRLEMELADFHMPDLGPIAPNAYFEIRGKQRPLFRSESLAGKTLPASPVPGSAPLLWNTHTPDGRAGRAVTFSFVPPLEHPEFPAIGKPETLSLVLLRERQSLDGHVKEIGFALALLALFLLVALPVVVASVVPRALRPLDELAAAVALIDSASLSRHFDEKGLPQELQVIVRQLNLLLERLRQSFEREQQFSADIAHELRTPIAELRSLAEVGLSDPLVGQAKSALQDARDIALQMNGLVTGLLALARVQVADHVLNKVSFDLALLFRELWATQMGEVTRKSLRIEGMTDASVTVRADRLLVQSVAMNLVENAVAYSPVGGTIRVQINVGSDVSMAVSNMDESLTDAELPRVFDRLWRKDAARTDGMHSGLGLSIAKEFAARLQGTLVVQRADAKTLSFVFRFPNASEESA